jgi:hypothetical protein
MTSCIIHQGHMHGKTPMFDRTTLRRKLYPGVVPPDYHVTTTCQTPNCINPEHLTIRHKNAPRQSHKGRKFFTPIQIEEIRASTCSIRHLAQLYDTHPTNILNIRKHRTYRQQ